MATEIAEGGQATFEAFARMRDTSFPLEDRYDPNFVDHDPAEGSPRDRAAWLGSGSSSVNRSPTSIAV